MRSLSSLIVCTRSCSAASPVAAATFAAGLLVIDEAGRGKSSGATVVVCGNSFATVIAFCSAACSHSLPQSRVSAASAMRSSCRRVAVADRERISASTSAAAALPARTTGASASASSERNSSVGGVGEVAEAGLDECSLASPATSDDHRRRRSVSYNCRLRQALCGTRRESVEAPQRRAMGEGGSETGAADGFSLKLENGRVDGVEGEAAPPALLLPVCCATLAPARLSTSSSRGGSHERGRKRASPTPLRRMLRSAQAVRRRRRRAAAGGDCAAAYSGRAGGGGGASGWRRKSSA